MSAVSKNTNLKQLVVFPYVLVVLEILAYLSTDMYLPALPSISKDLGISQDMTQYTLTIWFLGSMSMQLFLGPISESYGRKPVLILGGIVFILTSFICAQTDNITLFLIARFFQGSTVCAVIVAGYATIHDIYEGKKAVQILAVMSSITILAPALGPFVGAAIISFRAWHDIFNLLAVLALISLIGIVFFMPSGQEKKRLEGKAVINNYVAIFTNSKFIKIALLNSLLIINFFIWIVESPFVIIKHYGKSELYFGIAQLFVFSGYIIGAQMAKFLITRLTPKQVCNLGLSIVGLGMSLFAVFSYLDISIIACIGSMIVIALGSSSMSGLYNRLAIESAGNQPMAQRVAIYSLMISLAASVGSYLVTLVNDMSFDNIAGLMLVCYCLALIIYNNIKTNIALKS